MKLFADFRASGEASRRKLKRRLLYRISPSAQVAHRAHFGLD